MGESYGTTRAAGIAGHLAERGISFNGITLLDRDRWGEGISLGANLDDALARHDVKPKGERRAIPNGPAGWAKEHTEPVRSLSMRPERVSS